MSKSVPDTPECCQVTIGTFVSHLQDADRRGTLTRRMP